MASLPRTLEADSGKLRLVEVPNGEARPAIAVAASLRLVAQNGEERPRNSILLAHGSGAVRRILAALLIRQGYRVSCCSDGDAAVRFLRYAPAELVITGMVMASMDGLELIVRLRRQHGRLPIIALGEEADRMSRIYLRYAGLAGAASTLELPVRRETFLGEIARVLADARHAIRGAV